MSCDTSFNPSAPFQPRMVIYSILMTDSDTQYVRIYSSYNPPDYDPTKNPDEISITDAQVSVQQEGGPTFTFQLMTIPRADTSRYPSSIKAYVAYPFRPQEGKRYSLTVSSPSYGVASAATLVPNKGSANPTDGYALRDPWHTKAESYGVTAALAPETKGYLVRFYVDYLSPLPAGGYKPKRLEVPINVKALSLYRGTFERFYPHPLRRTTSATLTGPWGQNLPVETVSYSMSGYQFEIKNLYDFTEGCGVRFVQAVSFEMQFDAPLWNYWGSANLFRDPNSVRLDESGYSNVKGGAGVFGSIAVDSTLWGLPEKMPPPAAQGTAGCQ
jgi:hypothetical protein